MVVGEGVERSSSVSEGKGRAYTQNMSQRCIYCGQTKPDTAFIGREHILPESMGNKDYVLARGIVCDQCNNNLSTLDNALLKFEPVSFFLTYLGIPSKAGKIPEAKLGTVSMKRMKNGEIQFDIPKFSTRHIETIKNTKDKTVLQVKSKGSKLTSKQARTLIRGFYKVGLAMVAHSKGTDSALDSRYDLTRKYIHDDPSIQGLAIFPKKYKQRKELNLRLFRRDDVCPTASIFVIVLFGCQVEVELELNHMDVGKKAAEKRGDANILQA